MSSTFFEKPKLYENQESWYTDSMLIEDLLKEQKDFSDAEKNIADYFLKERENIRKQGIRAIAKKIYVAPSSIVRFCQKIGFEGLNSFKERYLEELNYNARYFHEIDPNRPFEKNDGEVEISGKIAGLYSETVMDTLSLLEKDTLQKAVSILDRETVYIITLSAQRGISENFKEKMMKIERRVIILNQTHDISYEIEHASADKCAFLFLSYTGESEHVVTYAAKAMKAGFPCVAITSYGLNRLSDLIPCSIHVSSKEKLISNLGNFSFALSSMYILDILYANIFNLDYEKNRKRKTESSRKESEPAVVSRGRKSSNPELNK